ncbi:MULTISPECIES: M15 family metallopeptidase [Cellulomonas]|uniref:M15 family metallopeptidase n=1 Tax=Cellulomonas TaxID=1707 RepID=UPI000626856D|nr:MULTISPECIES: M15 family metallopeptidase [Cellulomonas]MBO9569067.1 M15 family metallopeptidase [Cellulomonas iranensis]
MHNPTRRRRALVLVGTVVVVVVAVTWALTGAGLLGSAASGAPGGGVPSAAGDAPQPDLDLDPDREPGVEDGVIDRGDGVTIFDTHLPAIANLDPALRAAVEQATTDAGARGVEMVVTSGWRSAHYQQHLLDEAVRTRGSLEEARKWVSTPELSRHVTGDAVDIGYTDADSWLAQHGTRYGLCTTYANEMWHFELVTEPGGECPPAKADGSS